MPIPKLNEHGLLAVGIHDCTFAEIQAEFGQDQWIEDQQSESRREVLCPQRSRLCSRFRDYLTRLGGLSFAVEEVVINGSFVTAKPDPNDIDMIVVLPAGHDFSRDLPAAEYNLLSRRRLREAGYPFDVLVVAAGGTAHEKALELFQQVRDRSDLHKGLLRVRP
jgi:hypothetical protein